MAPTGFHLAAKMCPEAKASMKALVPDLAMVPKLLIISFLVIPIPVSWMINWLLDLSGMIWILKSGSTSRPADSGSQTD